MERVQQASAPLVGVACAPCLQIPTAEFAALKHQNLMLRRGISRLETAYAYINSLYNKSVVESKALKELNKTLFNENTQLKKHNPLGSGIIKNTAEKLCEMLLPSANATQAPTPTENEVMKLRCVITDYAAMAHLFSNLKKAKNGIVLGIEAARYAMLSEYQKDLKKSTVRLSQAALEIERLNKELRNARDELRNEYEERAKDHEIFHIDVEALRRADAEQEIEETNEVDIISETVLGEFVFEECNQPIPCPIREPKKNPKPKRCNSLDSTKIRLCLGCGKYFRGTKGLGRHRGYCKGKK